MSKLIVLVLAIIGFANANPVDSDSSDLQGNTYDNNGYWRHYQFPQFPAILKIQMPVQPQASNLQGVNMKAVPGGVVNGVSQIMTSHTEYVDGKPVTKTLGQTVWNRNGDIQKESFEN